MVKHFAKDKKVVSLDSGNLERIGDQRHIFCSLCHSYFTDLIYIAGMEKGPWISGFSRVDDQPPFHQKLRK